VHAIVVAYHAPDALDRCLESLERAIAATVVDNSSSGEVAAVVAGHGADYIDPGRNVGFAAGVNTALRRLVSGDPVDALLLNPDAAVGPEAVDALASFLDAPGNERVGAVSPMLEGAGGYHQRVEWPFPSPGRAWAEAVGLGALPAARTFVVGAVLLLRWEALRDVGLFDERYFLYAEETDWQRRALEYGWISAVCSNVAASHIGAATSTDAIERERRFHAAHELYVRKWHGSRGWLVFRTAVCLGATVRAGVLRGDRSAEAARRAALYFRGPLRSIGAAGD
jgi:GT2 family glycosyltransferase